MLQKLAAAWSIPDLRGRIIYVLMMFVLFILGLHIPVPGVDLVALERLINETDVLNLFDVFSGSALRRFTIFALGITPYINASIVMQLMTVAIPKLQAMQKEGESGRREIARITRWLTVGLSVVQAFGLIQLLRTQGAGMGAPIFTGGPIAMAQVALTLTAGSVFLMWIGESITEKGIGQGVSMLIFLSIMNRLPYDVSLTWQQVQSEAPIGYIRLFVLLVFFLLTVIGILYVNDGARRIPIQHARRQIGGKVSQTQGSFLPFKVNSAGVMPIIFAIILLTFPAQLFGYFVAANSTGFLPELVRGIIRWTTPTAGTIPGTFAAMLYAGLILAFTYFYASVLLNLQDISDNLKKFGSFIPGIRPGRSTQEYLDKVVSRITFAGAIFLAAVGLLQYYIPAITGITTFTIIGGTSVLIVVGVAIDFMQNLEAHLVMRNYEGFIRSPGKRGGQGGQGRLRLR